MIEAADARSQNAEVSGGGTLTMISSQQQGSAMVVADGLSPLPGSRSYQFWTANPDQPYL